MKKPFLFFSQEVPSLGLQRELLALGMGGIRPGSSLLLASLLALSGVGVLPNTVLVLWVSAALASTLVGYGYRYGYRRLGAAMQAGLSAAQIRGFEWAGVAYGAATGVVWGCSAWLLMPQGNPEYNLIIITVYLGVCAGAGSLSIFGLAHLLVASALGFVLFVARFPVIFPQHWLALMVMFLLYHAVIVRMAWARNGMIMANLLLREEKDQLLALQRVESQKAQQANHDKSAFLAAASHDLRQPVHALMLTSHTLRMQLPSGENRDLADRILAAGHALSEQFNNLMDLSRLESGAYQPRFSAVALHDLLQRVCTAHRQMADSAGIELRLRVSRHLRAQMVMTDVGLLGRSVSNLLENAVKFSARGDAVLMAASVRAGRIHLAVYDQGKGMAAEQLPHIFKAYVQLDNPERDRAKGIGLGLSIVQQAVLCMGGALAVRSQPARGSCFSMSFPAAMLAAPRTPSRAAPPRENGIGKLQGRRLLLVEDDAMAAQALQSWAASLGLVVQHHANPSAVDLATAPDIILCDIRLPGARDGISWLTEWLAHWPDARGVLLSGELQLDIQQRVEQEGLLLLSKPVNPEVLLQTLVGLAR